MAIFNSYVKLPKGTLVGQKLDIFAASSPKSLRLFVRLFVRLFELMHFAKIATRQSADHQTWQWNVPSYRLVSTLD